MIYAAASSCHHFAAFLGGAPCCSVSHASGGHSAGRSVVVPKFCEHRLRWRELLFCAFRIHPGLHVSKPRTESAKFLVGAFRSHLSGLSSIPDRRSTFLLLRPSLLGSAVLCLERTAQVLGLHAYLKPAASLGSARSPDLELRQLEPLG